MVIVGTIIGLIISLGLIGGITFVMRKKMTSSVEAERKVLQDKIKQASDNLDDLMRYAGSYASRAQFDSVVGQVESTKADLENEKSTLKDIESKLDVAQRSVEEKEQQQQELKSAKEEDEIKLEELLASYSNLSSDSISLEQRLAASLKNLDVMMEEVEMAAEHKAVVGELSSALEVAGSTLRDLITEYETLNERLNNLRLQHEDLEDEYTKLVEQQLGE